MRLTLFKGLDDKDVDGKWNTLLGFSELGPKPAKTIYDPKGGHEFPCDFGISTNRPGVLDG